MVNTLSKKEIRYFCIMLFGMFFGSGNLIFPIFLGKEATSVATVAFIFFVISAVVFPIIGTIVISDYDGGETLLSKVSKGFALFFPVIIYLTIGPFLATPRNGSMAFEMALRPYLAEDAKVWLWRLIFTAIFFGIVFFMTYNPNNLIEKLGKFLTPTLIILIVVMFLGVFFKDTLPIIEPKAEYFNAPAIKGFLDGYNTMDTLATINFAIVIVLTLKNKNILDSEKRKKYILIFGIVAGIMLTIVYAMLVYAGVKTSGHFPDARNGAELLIDVTRLVFGTYGTVLIGLIFLVATLSVSIGLITSISVYFSKITKLPYLFWVVLYIFISFVLSNLGLDNILKYSVNILYSIYPTCLVVITIPLFKKMFNDNDLVYKITVNVTLVVSILLVITKILKVEAVVSSIPLYNLDLGWILFSVIAFVASVIYVKVKKV